MDDAHSPSTRSAARRFLVIVLAWVAWSALQPTLFGDHADTTWPAGILEGLILGIIGLHAWWRPSRSGVLLGTFLFLLTTCVRVVFMTYGEIGMVLAGFQLGLAVVLVGLVLKSLLGRRAGRAHSTTSHAGLIAGAFVLLNVFQHAAAARITEQFPGTIEGATALVTYIQSIQTSQTEAKAVVSELKPSRSDCEAVFVADVVETATKSYDETWETFDRLPVAAINPPREFSEVQVWKVDSTEFKAGAGDAAKFGPTYGRIADKLKPGVTWYGCRYVKPGRTLSMTFNGLVHVNGRWVWFYLPSAAIGVDR